MADNRIVECFVCKMATTNRQLGSRNQEKRGRSCRIRFSARREDWEKTWSEFTPLSLSDDRTCPTVRYLRYLSRATLGRNGRTSGKAPPAREGTGPPTLFSIAPFFASFT